MLCISGNKYLDEFNVILETDFSYGGNLIELEDNFEDYVSSFFFHCAEKIETAD
jgi:hypothetical protein